jgi:DNA repair ATPase RecN
MDMTDIVDRINMSNNNLDTKCDELKQYIDTNIEDVKVKMSNMQFDKDLDNKVDKQDLQHSVQTQISSYLQEYAKVKQLKEIKTEFYSHFNEIKIDTNEMKEQSKNVQDNVYKMITANFRQEWDLKYENLGTNLDNLKKEIQQVYQDLDKKQEKIETNEEKLEKFNQLLLVEVIFILIKNLD